MYASTSASDKQLQLTTLLAPQHLVVADPCHDFEQGNTTVRIFQQPTPGVGPITATAIATTVTDPSGFRSGRQFAAWLGLVPRQNSSGGKERLGGICKQGDRYIRRLLIIGAHAVIRYARAKGAALDHQPARP